MGCAFSASSQDYWVDIGSVEAEEQDGVVLVPVRINKITDQGFTVPGEVGSGDNVRVWYSTSPYHGYAFDRNNTGTSNRPVIDTVSGEDYEETSGWLRFRRGDSEKSIPITLINDDKHELGEAIIIALSFANDAEQGTSTDGKAAFQSNQGHVFIQNNDCYGWEVQLREAVPPSCRLPVATTALDVEAEEGEDLKISVTLDTPVRADIRFPYEIRLAADDDTDVDLARKEDFVDNINTGDGSHTDVVSIVVPAGSTNGSLTLPLKKGDGYEKRRETFDVTLDVGTERAVIRTHVSTSLDNGETRPSLAWRNGVLTASLADAAITASIVNVDECERGIDDSDGTGDSGICRLYPEAILGHLNWSAQKQEGKNQKFGGRGRRNTAPSYFDEIWDDHLKVNWRLVPDTAMAGVDYTGPESGTLNIRKTARLQEGFPFWESSTFLIPTVDRRGVQGPRTFYVEVTPHADNPELLFIVPDIRWKGNADADFWDFGQTTGCDIDPCRISITFDDDLNEDNFFPGRMKLISTNVKFPEYLTSATIGGGISHLATGDYDKLTLDEDGSGRYTSVRFQTFDTGTGEGYATAGTDYAAVDTTERVYVDMGTAVVSVPIVTNDGLLEGDEEFGYRMTFVDWDDAPLVGTIFLLDKEIEFGAHISIYGVDYDGGEGSKLKVHFQVNGDDLSDRTYEVEVFTELLGNGAGYANTADFAHKSRTFTVTGNDDDTYTSFFVDILEDGSGEPAEKFGVVLRLKNAPDLATRSAAVTVTIKASDEAKPLNVEDSVDEVACTVSNNACAVDDEMIGRITAVTETVGGTERSVYVDAIAGGHCCAKCADDPIVGSNVILETLDNGFWSSGLTGGIVDADVGEYLRTLHQATDSCAITVGVQLRYPYEDQPLYILDLEPEEATVDEGDSVLMTATLDPAQGELLPFYLETISGTATIHKDFVDAPLTNFEFAIGETEVEYGILTLVDSEDEDDEVFVVHLGKDGVNFSAIYSTITIIDDSANNTTDGGSRGDGGMIDKVSETVFTYTDNIDGSAPGEKANSAGQYAFLVNDTNRPKLASGRYPKLRVSDWYTVTMALDAFSLNVEDGNGTSLDCPTDLASGQNAGFDWGDGNSVGFYVYGAFVSNNGARCVFEASPSGHTGDPGQVPSGAVIVTFTPAMD